MYTSGWPAEMAERGISTLRSTRPAGRGAAAAGLTGADRDRGLGAGLRATTWRHATTCDTDRIGLVGWSARRLLRPARSRVREAARPGRCMGRQPRLGRGAEASPGARGREARCRTTGSTCCGCGVRRPRRRSSTIADGVYLDGVVEQIDVPLPHHPRRERPADPAGLRAPLVRAGRQRPKRELRVFSADEGGDRAHRARPPAARRRLHRRLGRGHLRGSLSLRHRGGRTARAATRARGRRDGRGATTAPRLPGRRRRAA